MQFHDRLAVLMEDRRLTIYRLSKDLDITTSLISYWCRGMRQPAMDNLIKLANYFGVSIDYLVGQSDDPERR